MKRNTLYPAVLSLLLSTGLLFFQTSAYGYGPEEYIDYEEQSSVSCDGLPGTLVCASDALYQTFAEWQAAGGIVNFSPGCSTISSFQPGSLILIGGSIYSRSYSFEDDCGNLFSCTHTFELTGSSDVVFSGCASVTVMTDPGLCTSSAVISPPTATDGCGSMVPVSGTIPSTFVEGANELTFSANGVMCSMTVTVIDNEIPTISCPPSGMHTCDDQDTPYTTIATFKSAGGTIMDNCSVMDSDFSIEHSDVVSGTCPKTITRTYTIRDKAGNPATCTQTITIEDTTAPVLSGCSDVMMTPNPVVCDMEVTFDIPTVVETCAYTLYNTYTGDMSNTAVFEGGTTPVHWIATDACGNSDTCTITVTLNMPPRVTFPTLNIDKKSDIPNYTTYQEFTSAGGMISAHCHFDTLSFMSSSTCIPIDGCSAEVQISVSLMDTMTNMIKTSVHKDTIVDMEAPTFTNCPAAVQLLNQDSETCEYLFPSMPIATDDLVVDTLYIQDTVLVGNNLTLTWIAIDQCGKSTTCMQEYILNDGKSPEMTVRDTTVMCLDQAAGHILPTIMDFLEVGTITDCNLDSTTYTYVKADTIGNSRVEHTYRIMDIGGATSSIKRNIYLVDTTVPTFSAPMDTTVDCSVDITDKSMLGDVTQADVMDNCGMQTTITSVDKVAPGSCPIKRTISRIWMVTDASGNTAVDTQFIYVQDTISPVFDKMPADLDTIGCGDPLPVVERLTATDDCDSIVAITVDTIGTRMVCSNTLMTYMWIATDSCGNSDTLSRNFVSAADTLGPNFSMVSTDTVIYGSSPGICGVVLSDLVAPVPTDNCSGTSAVVVDAPQLTYAIGHHKIRWEATDGCGNKSTFDQDIDIKDTEAPVIKSIAKFTLSLTHPASANILEANRLIINSSDNCGKSGISYKIRRMASACGKNETSFGESVTFCCADILNGIMVEIVAVDAAGNESTPFMMHIPVSDKTPPKISAALPDLTISCSVRYNTSDLSIFGSYQTLEADREDITYYEDDILKNAGRDGLVEDICPLVVQDTFDTSGLNDCGIGTLRRIFTFTDSQGQVTTDTQRITITMDMNNIFDPSTGVKWPEMYVQEGCLSTVPDTSVAGQPIITNNTCSMLSIPKYKDEMYMHPKGGCDKIIRRWSFIDWCIYDGKNLGIYTHEQVIKIQDTLQPIITNPVSTLEVAILGGGCSTPVTSSITAMDDCTDVEDLVYTYEIDREANGSIDIKGKGSTFTHILPMGRHIVTWYVTDYCGNDTPFVQTINVVDGHAPEVTCLDKLNIALPAGGVTDTVLAKNFILYGVDNCGNAPSTIRYAFSADPLDTARLFTCADVGEDSIDVYAIDVYDNYNFCRIGLHIQDNGNYCGSNTSSLMVQGKITTETQVPIAETMVRLNRHGESQSKMTSQNGKYAFRNIDKGHTYVLDASRGKNILEGINVRDMLVIQRHLLGIKKIESPYKLLAADVDNSGSIDPRDILELRKVILRLSHQFPNNKSWRFVSMLDTTMSEILEIDNAQSSIHKGDFIGVKIGDVNNSIDQVLKPETRSRREQTILEWSKEHLADGNNRITIRSTRDMDVAGVQIGIDVNDMNVLSVKIGNDESVDEWTMHDGKLKIAYAEVDELYVQNGEPLISFVLDGNLDDVSLTDDIHSMIVTSRDEVEDIYLEESRSEGLALYQNVPNPFSSYTDVGFYLEKEEKVVFHIHDMRGSLVYAKRGIFPAGYNTIRFDSREITASGVMLLKMHTAKRTKQLKIVRLQ